MALALPSKKNLHKLMCAIILTMSKLTPTHCFGDATKAFLEAVPAELLKPHYLLTSTDIGVDSFKKMPSKEKELIRLSLMISRVECEKELARLVMQEECFGGWLQTYALGESKRI